MSCFVDQSICLELGFSNPSLKTCLSGDRSHPYRKDRWRLHCIICVLPSRTGNRYDSLATPLEKTKELGQYLVICCLSFVICILNLFVAILFLCCYNAFFFIFFIFICIPIMLVSFYVLNYD